MNYANRLCESNECRSPAGTANASPGDSSAPAHHIHIMTNAEWEASFKRAILARQARSPRFAGHRNSASCARLAS
eukprot:6794506-Pyramimonas_sp.AAC.1